ncbi:MAG: ComF family protein, partial [Bacteroidota bacterium]
CLDCYLNLPRTKFKSFYFNLATERLEGRFPLVMGYALLHFEKHSMVQKLIHGLKYKGERHTGYLLGQLLGREFVQNHEFKSIDLLIPIPLHPKKQIQRGYNQSELIGKGMAEVMNKPIMCDVLKKEINTNTQTNKSRADRLSNVTNVFSLINEKAIEGKHILIVDDILTTGATIEAAATVLLEAKNVRISFATVAMAALS